MKRYASNSGALNQNQSDYICSMEEFERETDARDGATLIVINTQENKVAKACIAFNGRWADA